jgi:hypothetical protein
VSVAPGQGQEDSSLEALHLFIRTSKENAAAFWSADFANILAVVLQLIRDADTAVRDMALKVLRELLRNQRAYFTAVHTAAVVTRLLDCHSVGLAVMG